MITNLNIAGHIKFQPKIRLICQIYQENYTVLNNESENSPKFTSLDRF